jgi:DNA-binding transcriptional ArsR family regulator
MQDVTVAGILHALADPVRVAIYAQLAAATGASCCSDFLQVSERSIPKSTLSQHFRALREAGLIRSERYGVEMRNVSRCGELEQRFPGLLRAIMSAHRSETAGMNTTKRRPAAGRSKAAGSRHG